MPPTTHTVTLIPGDGIGPELAACTKRMIAACGAKIEWDEHDLGAAPVAPCNANLARILDSIRTNRVALKGPTSTLPDTAHAGIEVTLRRALDLYASVHPIRSIPTVSTRSSGLDFILVRATMSDEPPAIERDAAPSMAKHNAAPSIAQRDAAPSMAKHNAAPSMAKHNAAPSTAKRDAAPSIAEPPARITEAASLRIAKYAFQLARDLGRERVTAVHEVPTTNVSDDPFLLCTRRIAAKFPDIALEELPLDACTQQLLDCPAHFDVLVTTGPHGDKLSTFAADLIGGPGIVPGAIIGDDYALYEAAQASAPDIEGRTIANPTALALSGAMLLRQLGLRAEADRLERAIRKVLQQGESLTPDLGGSATSATFTDAVIAAMI